MSITHTLHAAVGDAIVDIVTTLRKKGAGLTVILDPACRGKQQLPFFLDSNTTTRETQVSKVDVMILKNGKVKLVCEIEESGFNPTKIFGKVFSTGFAACSKLKDNSTIYPVSEDGYFIQVLSSDNMTKGLIKSKHSKKSVQADLIEDMIKNHLSSNTLWIKEYFLLQGNDSDFLPGGKLYKSLYDILIQL